MGNDTFVGTAAEDALADFVRTLGLGARQGAKGVTLWPLVRALGPSEAPEYVSAAEAFAAGSLAIEELAGGAMVPKISVANRGPVAVLVLFGEELRGAKQNRVANASFLVPADARVEIDVSCVEAGRWAWDRARAFSAEGEVLSAKLRQKMALRVSASRRAARGFRADQTEVWNEVASRVVYSRAHAPSAAYSDYVKTRAVELDELARAFRTLPGQVGFVACLGDEVVGLEAIGRPEVFARAFRGLLRGYLVDAVDRALLHREGSDASGTVRFDGPERFLAALAQGHADVRPSLGLGADVRIDEGPVRACALVAGDVVQLTAFPVGAPPPGGSRRWEA